METNKKYTKGEWNQNLHDGVVYCDGLQVADCTYFLSSKDTSKANAARIVECVNGYSALQSENERLREALQRFVDFAEKQLEKQGETYRSSMILQAKDALNTSTVKEVGSNG